MNEFLNRYANTIGAKLRNLAGVLLLILALTLAGGVFFSNAKQTEAVEVNISGRQRMLTQRMSKNSLLIDSFVTNTMLDAGQMDQDLQMLTAIELHDPSQFGGATFGDVQLELQSARDLYDRSLTDLYEGNTDLGLPTASPETQLILDDVQQLWLPFRDAIDVLLDDGATVAQIHEATTYISANNNALLTRSNDVVQQLETEATQSTTTLYTFFSFMLLMAVGGFVTSQLIARSIVTQADNLTATIQEIDKGNFDARATAMSEDELGQFATALNGMMDRTLSFVRTEDERDDLQNAIFGMLEELTQLAEGDLTVTATVDDSMLGAVADSFNFMIEQLREIIGNVQNATEEVSSSASQIQLTAETLARGSEAQASQIVDTSAAIDEMSLSIQQVSENAALSAIVGQESQANAQIGSKAVSDTIAGMGRIREQVETTAERLERLNASSREIGKITKVINDISERTSILAINASIQASEAGDAGRGFAVVAEEVERLADRSVLASSQINRLVRTIQDETIEVIRAMELTSTEVARGSRLAQEAGERLDEIESVSSQLSDLIQSISQSAQQQARGSEVIAKSMNEIADVTQRTAAGTQQATSSIGKLAILADELSDSVSQFKIDGPDSAEEVEEVDADMAYQMAEEF